MDQQLITNAAPEKVFRLVGGELCLDFCNTVGGKRGRVARENLHTYSNLTSWSRQAGILNQEQVAELNAKAHQNSEQAAFVLARAVKLREAIYDIMLDRIEDRTPESANLESLNHEIARTLNRLRIGHSQTGFTWGWSKEPLDLDFMIGPIVYSAARLLASDKELAQVRQCGGDNCGWLFLDSSKNHSRCWCDMRDCGNLAKVRRHRQKQRGATQNPDAN